MVAGASVIVSDFTGLIRFMPDVFWVKRAAGSSEVQRAALGYHVLGQAQPICQRLAAILQAVVCWSDACTVAHMEFEAIALITAARLYWHPARAHPFFGRWPP